MSGRPTPHLAIHFFCRVLHKIPSHLQAHAFSRSVTGVRSSTVQASPSRKQERRWAIVCGSPVAIHQLGVVEIAPSPQHWFRTAHPCVQSVKSSPTEPVLSSRQRPGHLQSHFDGGRHVFQAVFPEPQSAVARMKLFATSIC